MKKRLIYSFLAFSFSLVLYAGLSTTPAHALDEFSCVWSGTFCGPDFTTSTCTGSNTVDATLCTSRVQSNCVSTHACRVGNTPVPTPGTTLPNGCLLINITAGGIDVQCAGKTTCPGNGVYCCDNVSKCSSIAAPAAPAPGGVTYAPSNPNCDANGDSGILTGLGCLSVEGTGTIQTLLNWGVVIGAGIAFVMILLAALQINTARGDAKRVAAAKELLFSALSGLALIALSVVLLNFLGVNLLGLDTIGFKP